MMSSLSTYESTHSPEMKSKNMSAFTTAQYSDPFCHSIWTHTKLCIARQSILVSRNKSFWYTRIGQSILMGLVVGTLYYQSGTNKYSNRIGLMLFSCVFMAFGNMVTSRTYDCVRMYYF
jgi:hypothetical protein